MAMWTRGTAAVAATMACALAVAACGGSDDDGATAASTAAASGAPIKVMTIGPIDAPNYSAPSIAVGAQVAVEEVNAAGGIDGRPLELIVCDDGNDPNQAAGCARDAVQQDVAAIVGGFTSFEPQIVPIIERAGIPWIGVTAVQNSTSDRYYLLGGEGSTLIIAMGQYLAGQPSCETVSAVAENLPVVKAAAQLFELGVTAGGGTYVPPAYGAQNAADWAPVVAAATGKGASCLGILTTVATAPKVVTAIAQSGKDLTAATALSLLPADAVAALGDTADGTLVFSGYLPYSADAPAVRDLKAKAQAIDPDVPLDGNLQSTYASVKVLAEAATGLDDVDAASLVPALDALQGYDTGLGPVVDFTATNPAEAFRRIGNPKVYVLEAEGGELLLATPEPVDTTPAFQALAAAG